MHRRGFALLEVLVVVVIIAAVAGGGFYFNYVKNEYTAAKTGADAVQQADRVALQEASATAAATQVALDQIMGTTEAPASTSPKVPAKQVAALATSSITAATSVATDPLAGLGSNIYASGNLPLGDGKYVTNAPKKGYVYLCNVNTNGQGAQESGPWIGATTWNTDQKVAVAGAVSWPNASYSMSINGSGNGSTRVITTNDLPSGGITTGNFPIAASDPAHAYDQNPNSVKTQSLSFSFPAAPVAAASPSCIGGEVGVMTDGVVLFDGFDAELRDAVAHELQDSCEGHPQEAGEYHYHGPSSCLPNGSSTVIGFAFDGFPITGAKIASNRYLTTADLDECHGITSPVMLDGKMVSTYHYVMTEDFPYSVSCFRGTSTVHGPTAGTTSGGGSGAGAGGTPPQPPAAAIAACSGKYMNGSCSFSGGQGTISGTCQTPPGQSSLACVPAH